MIKSFLIKSVLVALLSLTSAFYVSAHAGQDNAIKQQIRSDKDYHANVAKARSMLQARGYQVKDIEAHADNGQKCLGVEAYKGAVKYDIKLVYPDLKIIKEKADK